MPLTIKPKEHCKWDLASLGEVMLRLDPGDERIRTTRTFRVWEGGGEYNVARAIRRCFGMRATFATAIVDNEIGRLLEDLMLQGGVDLSYVNWVPFDGVGRASRVGLNFTERGFGPRAAVGNYDRAWSAASQMKPGEVNWKRLFQEEGVRWFHTGGIFAGLSENTAELAIEAMQAARAAGTIVSYDLNFRPSLWRSQGGMPRAVEVNRKIASLVDVLFDFTAALGYPVPNLGETLGAQDVENFKKTIGGVTRTFPNLKAVTTALRTAPSASTNDWGALLWTDGQFHEAPIRKRLEIYDRVGAGDGFSSGVIYCFLAGKTPQDAVEYGAANGALAMTTPGDTCAATLEEIESVAQRKDARVAR